VEAACLRTDLLTPNAHYWGSSAPTYRGGNTEDRAARTANRRRAFEDKFLAEAGGNPQRAESLRRAYFARLALKSTQARRRGVARKGGDGS
jgi:hypothetical protein